MRLRLTKVSHTISPRCRSTAWKWRKYNHDAVTCRVALCWNQGQGARYREAPQPRLTEQFHDVSGVTLNVSNSSLIKTKYSYISIEESYAQWRPKEKHTVQPSRQNKSPTSQPACRSRKLVPIMLPLRFMRLKCTSSCRILSPRQSHLSS